MAFLCLFITAVSLYFISRLRWPKSPPFPPGPRRAPLIGNLRCMPSTNRPIIFHEWAKTYGDVMYLEVLGQPMVILDTEQAAVALLNERSAIYSDRPRFVLYEMYVPSAASRHVKNQMQLISRLGWTGTLSLMRYGKRFAKHRQLQQSYLNRQKCLEFTAIQTLEARTLVHHLLEAPPADYPKFISRFSTGIISQIVAGHRIHSDDDPYVQATQAMVESLGRIGAAGETAIDLFPILQHFPTWFPGLKFAAVAKECRPKLRQLYDFPMRAVQTQRKTGEAKPSFLLTKLEEMTDDVQPGDLEDLSGAAAAMFGSSASWNHSILTALVTSFVLAMLLHPEYQVRAQHEIDSVIGSSRLPRFEDREHLPLIDCILQETLRWHPPTELGVPHRLMEDDVYRGMFIPKGCTVIANIRGMSLNENIYSSARSFLPERYLPQPVGRAEPHFAPVYGFGRRVCPGQHLGDQSLWIAIASILASCNITNSHDEQGNVIVPEDAMSDGVSSHPKDFQYIVSPRSLEAKALLEKGMDL
ncbi:cytochrome P450 [Mycena vulgaris]|nr:cytochrome P450 [Mycena vulgaris]